MLNSMALAAQESAGAAGHGKPPAPLKMIKRKSRAADLGRMDETAEPESSWQETMKTVSELIKMKVHDDFSADQKVSAHLNSCRHLLPSAQHSSVLSLSPIICSTFFSALSPNMHSTLLSALSLSHTCCSPLPSALSLPPSAHHFP